MKNVCLSLLLVGAAVTITQPAAAELKMSAVFGDHMVLQQKQPIRIWGWTKPGQAVTVSFADQKKATTAGDDGRFDLKLDAVPAGGPYTMTVAADTSKTFNDVLVGEVWLCSGQSNMQWAVNSANDPDLESLTAKYPNLRLITVPQTGTQETQTTFNGQWQACTPETVRDFSAVGYFFGRQLHQTLDVPVGLIDNAWGGSACEAWVKRDLLSDEGLYGPLLKRWEDIESSYDHEAAMAQYKQRLAKWNETKKGNRPRPPRNQLAGQHRPANLYHGVLKPVLGYTIKGTIWYQGESNASRAFQYRDLFPLMISSWREEWGQGDFSFYWVQLADFRAEKGEPADSDWAELREAQTMALSLPNTGEAVITDLGEAEDIHPKNKQDVAKRLARWALAQDYGIDIVYRSPIYKSMEVKGDKVHVTFDHVGGGMDTFDVRRPVGFTVATADGPFVAANARIVGKDTIEVWADGVESPAHVRYAWADNPICNVQNKQGLPLTPFRTDERKGVTTDNR
ncbi:MAG: sialate O-acetylesterase [Planctomycetaceae bacterium]|nr:sialate O-acetylesterase [Planctomycetaceae bacterium]